MIVIKRDGREVEYSREKIAKAIYKALLKVNGFDPNQIVYDVYYSDKAIEVSKAVEKEILDKQVDKITVEDIQDIVEKKLISFNLADAAKEYILYRQQRSNIRNSKQKLMQAVNDIIFVDAENSDSQRENANIDGNTTPGSMLKIAGTVTKSIALNYFHDKELADLHRSGAVHEHDLDHSLLSVNCLSIPLDKLLKYGFTTGHGYIRPPQTISTAATLTCIIVQSNQNDMFGGQSIPLFDYYLAPYVAKSFVRNCAQFIECINPYEYYRVLPTDQVSLTDDTGFSGQELKESFIQPLIKYIDRNEHILTEEGINIIKTKFFEVLETRYSDLQLWHIDKKFDELYKYALNKTDKDTFQAMEALVHNFCSLQARSGGQCPFSNINFGTDTSEEGRMVSKNLLLAGEAGLGAGETAIFPITIFTMKKGFNGKGDKNYDLFKLACRVSSKRMFPNFCNNDAPFNAQYYQEGRPDTLVSSMGMTAGGNVTVKYIYNTDKDKYLSGEATLDISMVPKYINTVLNSISALTGKVTYPDWRKFDEHTTYIDFEQDLYKDFNFIVADSSTIGGYTKIKKFMYTDKDIPNIQWKKVEYMKGDELQSPLYLSSDHPLSVKNPLTGQYVRTLVEDIKVGDQLTSNKDVLYLRTVTKISNDYRKHEGYDFETTSDHFDLDKINSHNCVSEDTRIVLKNPEGKIIHTTFGFFKILGVGVTFLKNWQILSSNGEFVDLINVSIREHHEPINIIHASHGSLKVTDEHIVPIYRNREYMEVLAKDLKINDCLICETLENSVYNDGTDEINLIDLIGYNNSWYIYANEKLWAWIVSNNQNINEDDKIFILRNTQVFPLIRLDYYLSIRSQLKDIVDEHDLMIGKLRSLKFIPVCYKLTSEFGRLLGLIYSEGCVLESKNVICVTNTNQDIIDFSCSIFKNVFKLDTINVSLNVNNCAIIKISSVNITELFKLNIFGTHRGSSCLKLPNWFFEANVDFLKGFLGGVIDGDGSVVPENYTRIITSSETFANDLQYLISVIGYKSCISVDQQKGKIATFGKIKTVRRFDNYRVTISNEDIVAMNIPLSLKVKKLDGYERIRIKHPDRKYWNRISSISKAEYSGYVYDVETKNSYFVGGTTRLHNCRTRVIANVFDPSHVVTPGRGNLFFITMNLPYLALEMKEQLGDEFDTLSYQERQDLYKQYLIKREDQIFKMLDDRFEVISKRKAKNFPFLMGQHCYLGSEKLKPDDEIKEVIKQGTLSVGFIGLAETLMILFDKHHGESELAQQYGLEIIKLLSDRCVERSKEKHLNYSLIGTPAEGCSGRLLRLTRKRFGIILGITDKEYLTNSSHIPVNYKTTIQHKVDIEAPYHQYETAGHIGYIELDASTCKNLDAFESIIWYMHDAGMGYFAINHPIDFDPICGYTGDLSSGICPRCGRKEGEGVAVDKLLSLTSYRPTPQYSIEACCPVEE